MTQFVAAALIELSRSNQRESALVLNYRAKLRGKYMLGGRADMEIVIIGASLSGLTLALACASRGIRTVMLERGHSEHRSGGALGIDRALLVRVVRPISRVDGSTSDFPVITGERKAASWLAVYEWLREQISLRDEIKLTEGVTVVQVKQTEAVATAITSDGSRIDAAIIVGADGYRSVVRTAINRAHPFAVYAGYLLWRGLVDEKELPRDTPWPQGHDGAGFITSEGHRLIAYPVADREGSLEPGERRISFAWYDTTHDALLLERACLSPVGHVLTSLTRDKIPPAVREALSEEAQRIWPGPWRAFVLHALQHRDIFATPVAEYRPERIHSGRLALVGDAAHAVSPMIGRGFVAGILDAEALADCLGRTDLRSEISVLSALGRYGEIRLREGQKLAENSIRMSRTYLSRVQRGNNFQEKR